ncbi:MAG: hypothetical protein ACLPWF_04745 [Bryobacteraceae bacterium]|jgi:hypothetical protein
MADRDLIFGEISRERQAQDAEWGGAAHDDEHGPMDWCSFVDRQRLLAQNANSLREFEIRMVKVAALAVAAIESSRRLSTAERSA